MSRRRWWWSRSRRACRSARSCSWLSSWSIYRSSTSPGSARHPRCRSSRCHKKKSNVEKAMKKVFKILKIDDICAGHKWPPTRPTLPQLWSFKIRGTTFLNYSLIQLIAWSWGSHIGKGLVGQTILNFRASHPSIDISKKLIKFIDWGIFVALRLCQFRKGFDERVLRSCYTAIWYVYMWFKSVVPCLALLYITGTLSQLWSL